MAVQTAVDVLARMLDAYESSEQSVHHVGATSMDEGGDVLQVVLKVGVPICSSGDAGAAPTGAALTDDGTITVQYPTDAVTAFPSPPDAEVSAVPTSARVGDGELLVSMEVTITPTTDGRQMTADTAAGDGTGNTDRTGTGARNTDRGGDGTGNTDRTGTGATTTDAAGENAEAAASTTTAGAAADGHGNGDVPDTIEAARNDAVPTYEDREYLHAIYREYDTFSEMREVLDMDVSTETVRRYMIDVGIHDPCSYETAGGSGDDRATAVSVGREATSEASTAEESTAEGSTSEASTAEASTAEASTAEESTAEGSTAEESTAEGSTSEASTAEASTAEASTAEESTAEGSTAEKSTRRGQTIPEGQLVTDGIGLPEDLTIEEVLEAVVDSGTVYGATRRLDLDQRRTREILEHLDLLELVMHRVADDHKRDVTYGDVADRLHRVAGSGHGGPAT
jgi:hypothetical protein